jgi:hypothetical protein
MTDNPDLNTMLSIFALCVRSPHRTRTLDNVVERFHSPSSVSLPATQTSPSQTVDIASDPYVKALAATQNGFRKTSLEFENTQEMERLIWALQEEGIDFELDPEAYVLLAERCLKRRGGSPAINL